MKAEPLLDSVANSLQLFENPQNDCYRQHTTTHWLCVVCEDSIGFTPVHKATGEDIAKSLIGDLNAEGWVGQYARPRIRRMCGNEWQVEWSPIYNSTTDSTDTIFPLRYANHRLNLALVHSSGKAIIRNTLTCVNSCSVFLISSRVIYMARVIGHGQGYFYNFSRQNSSKTRQKIVKNSSQTRQKLVKNSSQTRQKRQ